MTILVTGAAGFLGARLVAALLAGPPGWPPIRRIIAADVAPPPHDDPRVDARGGDVAEPAFAAALVGPGVDTVFHLAAVLSGQAEADVDLGMRVNVDATRSLLDACRHLPSPPRFVFTSTIAVYGGTLPEVVPEDMALRPSSSYGTAKAMLELLVADCTRRGFVEGVACRVPTVAVRPGRPSSALSSFVSGIIREPLAGLPTTCPVPLDTRLWVSSPETVVSNLLHAARVPMRAFDGRPVVNLPGLTVTPGEMLASLERVAGAGARALVRVEPDERISRVVCSWPGALDVTRSIALGFARDADVETIVQKCAGRGK